MKRTFDVVKKHFILSLGALLMSLSSFATDVTNPADGPVVTRASYRAAVTPVPERNQIRVAVERLPGEPMTIVLKNAQGHTVGLKQIGPKLEKFQFRFLLHEAPDGEYTVEIETPRDQSRHSFTLQTQPARRMVKLG